MSSVTEINDFKSEEAFYKLLVETGDSILDYGGLYNMVKYQGFNRVEFLRSAHKSMSAATLVRTAIIGGIRGSNFEKINKIEGLPSDVKALMTSGVILNRKPRSGGDITITRCTAAVPQWVAHGLLKAGAPSRVSSSGLHAALQFPSAGSLPMSKAVREEHIKFSAMFSKMIGGTFKSTIYKAMYTDRVSVAHVPSDVKSILGVKSDEDAMVDIDEMLTEYVDEEDEDEDTKKVVKKRKSRK